jgi:hypothetical protein
MPPLGPRRQPRFLADGMLGTLARKLRLCGFDTSYVQGLPDVEMLLRAWRENRTLLTSDEDLSARARSQGLPALLVTGRSEADRLAQVLGEVRLPARLQPSTSRCPICNGRIAQTPRLSVRSSVPPAVASRHRLFYRCEACGKVYWSGGHWRRLRRLETRVRQRLLRGRLPGAAASLAKRRES